MDFLGYYCHDYKDDYVCHESHQMKAITVHNRTINSLEHCAREKITLFCTLCVPHGLFWGKFEKTLPKPIDYGDMRHYLTFKPIGTQNH